MVKRILVTGGAGYIGSHTALQLTAAGHKVVVLDNLYGGNRWAVPPQAEFVQGDIADPALVKSLIRNHQIDAVIHFAAHVVVSESVENPHKYYHNNVLGSFSFIAACIECGIQQFIFSSSAAVYGIPSCNPVSESAVTLPTHPYGSSKLITEWMLRDLATAASVPFKFVALRYFNVAGARLDGKLGQSSPNATHLIKLSAQAACGTRPGLCIFGDDYPTADGTCLRDYIHIEDLVSAHLDAIQYLDGGGENIALNCGYGHGYSVKQVVECMKSVSNVDFSVTIEERRRGDPPELVADNTLIRQRLNWQPQHHDLSIICRTAYQWEQKLPHR